MILEVYDLESLSNLFTYTGYCPKEDKYYHKCEPLVPMPLTVKEVIKFDLDFGHRRYCNLGIEVPFTGQLLIGKDVIGDFTTRFGTWYWSYETVIELTLQNGVVTKSYDHSYTARVARRELKRQIQDKSFLDLRKLDHFIGNSLRKEYLEKTWWLK